MAQYDSVIDLEMVDFDEDTVVYIVPNGDKYAIKVLQKSAMEHLVKDPTSGQTVGEIIPQAMSYPGLFDNGVLKTDTLSREHLRERLNLTSADELNNLLQSFTFNVDLGIRNISEWVDDLREQQAFPQRTNQANNPNVLFRSNSAWSVRNASNESDYNDDFDLNSEDYYSDNNMSPRITMTPPRNSFLDEDSIEGEFIERVGISEDELSDFSVDDNHYSDDRSAESDESDDEEFRAENTRPSSPRNGRS